MEIRYTFLMMTKHAFIFLIILAVSFALYGFLVLATASGTSFFLIWLAAAALACGYAVLLRSGLFTRMSLPLRLALTLPVLAGIIVVLILSCVIMTFASDHRIHGIHEKSTSAPSYLIVLGAQVRESGPSLVLKYRLDAAAEYLEAHPDIVCVVSGGQGGNEPFPEAEGMSRYLENKGISPDRILLEDQSLNTVQNLRFSRIVIEEDLARRRTSAGTAADDPAGSVTAADGTTAPLTTTPGALPAVVLVTNDFHLFRASAIAVKQGFSDVLPLAAGSSPLYLPNNLLRECLGLVKDFLMGHL